MKLPLFMLLSVCILSACKSLKKDIPKTTAIVSLPTLVFELQTTSCYGRCPIYNVRIFDNDSLVYLGERYVKKEGQIIKKLPQKTVPQLVQTFRDANFFAFENAYTANISDLPTTYLSFYDAGKTKKIRDYYRAPTQLKKLEQLINDLVATEVLEEVK